MEQDNVKKPRHYISESGLESIDVMRAFGNDLIGVQAFMHDNIIKYALRCTKKNNILEDLRKCQRYCQMLIDDIEENGLQIK